MGVDVDGGVGDGGHDADVVLALVCMLLAFVAFGLTSVLVSVEFTWHHMPL